MPLFEFKCPGCGAQVQKLQRYDDAAPKCRECEPEPEMIRQVSRTSFVLKGGGWASSGYA
jgi:putative FmdB family regulatory protein